MPGGGIRWLPSCRDTHARLQAVRTIRTGDGAHGITFSDSGNHAYVTNQMADSLTVIRVDDRAVDRTIGVGMKPNGLVFRSR